MLRQNKQHIVATRDLKHVICHFMPHHPELENHTVMLCITLHDKIQQVSAISMIQHMTFHCARASNTPNTSAVPTESATHELPSQPSSFIGAWKEKMIWDKWIEHDRTKIKDLKYWNHLIISLTASRKLKPSTLHQCGHLDIPPFRGLSPPALGPWSIKSIKWFSDLVTYHLQMFRF